MSVEAPPVVVFGDHEEQTIEQLENCIAHGNVAAAALMADGHFGYSQPIGGVVAYRDQISPSGVGYDIACGNKAVRTMLTYGDIQADLSKLADAIFADIEFGIGRSNLHPAAQEHALFDDGRWNLLPEIASLKDELGRNQLGTVGGGNHYVDVFVECDVSIGLGTDAPAFSDSSRIWVGVHFGSRGFGHKTATGFMRLAAGLPFFPEKGSPRLAETDTPTVLDVDSDLGYHYLQAMALAGDYAYAGRDHVVQRVLSVLGTSYDYDVHNHHNYGWLEEHGGEQLWVVRKGATPLWPGQESFIGGSMCDIAVIARGVRALQDEVPHPLVESYTGTPVQRSSLFSTVHGAGRFMGRMQAKGKVHRKTGEVIRPGKVTPEMMQQAVADYGIELRGGDLDESPFVYRKLHDVLDTHAPTTEVLHTLRPIIVCMAPAKLHDPFKD